MAQSQVEKLENLANEEEMELNISLSKAQAQELIEYGISEDNTDEEEIQ